MQWHEESVCVGQNLLLRVSEYAQRRLWFSFILLSTTNKMQLYKVFFIIVSAVHVSGGETARIM